jgi:outer membrane protein assembly factor BamB
VTLVLGAGAAGASWAWLRAGEGDPAALRGPYPVPEATRFLAALPGELSTGEGEAAPEIPGSWPCFRGPDRDGVGREDIPLAESWPPEGPPRLWSLPVGEGYAGAAVRDGRVYLLDYDEGRVGSEVVPERKGDVLRCLSLADGREIWRRWYHVPIVRYHGISRTVPAVSERYVVSLGPLGHVLCCDAASGAAKWSRDLVAEFGTQIPEWYAGQCPLIDLVGGREAAILAPGGDRGALMIAIDCESGEELWRTPNPDAWHMTHSSIVRMDWEGIPTYVYCSTGGVVGVAAADGRVLWRYPDWRISPAIVPTPVLLDGNRILLSGGYRAGSRVLEIQADDAYEPIVVEVLRLDPRTLGAEQQSPIFYRGGIYAVLTKNAGPRREQLTCLSIQGAVLWSSGSERTFGLGPFLAADDKLFLMDDDGVLTMIRSSGRAYEELARAKVLEGPEAWGPMALVGGRLLARDLRTLACFDLRAGAGR